MIFRKKRFIISLVLFILLVVYQRVSSVSFSPQAHTLASQEVLSKQMQLVSPTISASPTPPLPQVQLTKQSAKVVSVTSGNTLEVLVNNTKETIQVLGLTIPSCFEKEAASFAEQTLNGQSVFLASDTDQPDKDGTLFRYVFLYGGSIDFGEMMISQGFARENRDLKAYRYQFAYQEGEKEARGFGKGLWVTASCASLVP